jgi:hypothetical protein
MSYLLAGPGVLGQSHPISRSLDLISDDVSWKAERERIDGRTACVGSGVGTGEEIGRAAGARVLVIVRDGEGRFLGGGRPVRAACGRTWGTDTEMTDAEDSEGDGPASMMCTSSSSDSEGGSDKGSESVSDAISSSLRTVIVDSFT